MTNQTDISELTAEDEAQDETRDPMAGLGIFTPTDENNVETAPEGEVPETVQELSVERANSSDIRGVYKHANAKNDDGSPSYITAEATENAIISNEASGHEFIGYVPDGQAFVTNDQTADREGRVRMAKVRLNSAKRALAVAQRQHDDASGMEINDDGSYNVEHRLAVKAIAGTKYEPSSDPTLEGFDQGAIDKTREQGRGPGKDKDTPENDDNAENKTRPSRDAGDPQTDVFASDKKRGVDTTPNTGGALPNTGEHRHDGGI